MPLVTHRLHAPPTIGAEISAPINDFLCLCHSYFTAQSDGKVAYMSNFLLFNQKVIALKA